MGFRVLRVRVEGLGFSALGFGGRVWDIYSASGEGERALESVCS